MTETIAIRFEELPALIIDGSDAGLMEGTADIEFDATGWHVESISIEVSSREIGEQGYAKFVWRLKPLSPSDHPAMHAHLTEMIEDRYRAKIEDDIRDYFDSIPDTIADMQREMRAAS